MTSPQYQQTILAYASGGGFAAGRPVFVVIHSTEGPMSPGNAVALAQWFAKSPANGGPGTSTTGIFDPTDNVRMLGENTIPYHCGPYGNPLSNGDEHCGSVNLTTEQWMSANGQAMLDASAKVQAQRARWRGWSLSECRWLTLSQVAAKTVRGFCTHNDIRLALGGTTHSDPGPNFPYAWYMDRIRAWYQDPINGGDDLPYTEDEIINLVRTGMQRELTTPGDPSRTAIRELTAMGVEDAVKEIGPDSVQDTLGRRAASFVRASGLATADQASALVAQLAAFSDAVTADDAVDDQTTADIKTAIQEVQAKLDALAPVTDPPPAEPTS